MRTTARTSSTLAGATTRAACPSVAAGRLLEAGDVVDARHEHGRDTLEQTGEAVAVHGWKAWSWGILEASLAGVISPM